MKKLMCLLVALLVAPAMATVTISVVDNGDCSANIVAVADGDDLDALGNSKVAGIALDVTVDAGQMTEVVNYKTTGESIVGDKGYGIFLGTITFTGGDPEEIASTGTPVAPASAPDAPGQLPGAAIVLEFGALYDQAVQEAAPSASTVLCTIKVSEACNMNIEANATRGGVVLIGGGAVAPVLVDGAIAPCGPISCYVGPSQAAYAEYIAAGYTDVQMESWCKDYQCVGDVMNNTETFFKYRVYITDLNEVVANWKKTLATGVNPASDIMHNSETFFKYRCYITDLNKVVENWKKTDALLGAGVCNVAP